MLQQMENHLGNKETEKTWQAQAADAAYKRNAALLNVSFCDYQKSHGKTEALHRLEDRNVCIIHFR